MFFCEMGPANEAPGFDSFDPSGFYGVTKYCMHSFDGLCNGREVVDTVGMSGEFEMCFFIT